MFVSIPVSMRLSLRHTAVHLPRPSHRLHISSQGRPSFNPNLTIDDFMGTHPRPHIDFRFRLTQHLIVPFLEVGFVKVRYHCNNISPALVTVTTETLKLKSCRHCAHFSNSDSGTYNNKENRLLSLTFNLAYSALIS